MLSFTSLAACGSEHRTRGFIFVIRCPSKTTYLKMEHVNERNCTEMYFSGEHLKFHELREKKIQNEYLKRYRQVPLCPNPVEFHVSNLRHDTCYTHFQAIMRDAGFKEPGSEVPSKKSLVWFSLAVSEDDIMDTERRFLQYYNKEANKPFLRKFTSSPAFRKSSRMGNFRFTFPVNNLLASYKDQFCMGQEPQMRKLGTFVYKQEVMYSIVIHGPEGQNDFGTYPLMQGSEANAVCLFQNGNIVWRAEGLSKTHAFSLGQDMRAHRINKSRRLYYAWDHVAVAFHIPQGRIFQFDQKSLRSHLSICQGAELNLSNEQFIRCEFEAQPPQ